MPEMTTYRPGEICWVALSTRSVADATKFYAGIFPWTFEDSSDPAEGASTLCKVRDRAVCEFCEQPAEDVSRGIPPHWMLYVSVADADASAARAMDLGGNVRTAPRDIADMGRMAVLEDPAGAAFAIWQPGKRHGAGLVREPEALDWNELTSTDTLAAERFYTRLFGWTAVTRTDLRIEYTEFLLGEQSMAGMVKARKPGMRSTWTTFFAVTDCDTAAANAKTLGARALFEPTNIRTVGRFAVIQDLQRAVFGLLQRETK